MRIIFGLHLDGLNPAAPRNAAGEATLGPSGLLQVLETQLGLPSPNADPGEAPFSYLQCLREASAPGRFFHRSLEVDPVNVARTLLDWRAQWYEAGWNGKFPEGAPARLTDMAAIEAIARQRVPPTDGQRLHRVAETLAERRTQIKQVELHTPFEDLPHAWQVVVRALPWVPARGLEFAAAGPHGSDLARVQRRLLPMADRDDGSAMQRECLNGDGSLVVLKSASKDLSAEAVAEFLLETRAIDSTLLIAESDGIVLDNALERAGLPRCGFQHYTGFRPATQVLKLALALVWRPVDPHRLLQFLLHPASPLPRWVRWRLADALGESPGIGSPAWIRSIEKIAETLREREEADESDFEHLRSDIAFWLEADRYAPEAGPPEAGPLEVGAPLEALIERVGRVSAWASRQSNTVENEFEAAMFAAAHAQAGALLKALEELRQTGARRIERIELQRRIDEVTVDAPDPSTCGEAGRARATAAPAEVTGPQPIVVWWNLAHESSAISHPWSRRELDALRASGVHLPEIDDIVRRRSREWLRPLCNAGERLILVAHHDDRGAHPLLTRIESLFEGLATVEIEPVLLAGGATLHPLEIRTRDLPPKRLHAPRRWWSLPPEYPIAPRGVESWSSLSKLCDYPHEWVLRYAARLRAGRAAALMDGARLFGNLGHRLFEEFFITQGDWRNMPDEAVLAWVRSELPGIVEREGAVLLGHGRGVDRRRITATLERALVRLLAHLRSAGVVEASAEVPVEVPLEIAFAAPGKVPCMARGEGPGRAPGEALGESPGRISGEGPGKAPGEVPVGRPGEAPGEGRRLKGVIDLMLTRGDGQRAVLDVKWAGETHRGKLLKKNRALQLATYACLLKNRDGSDAWPAGAFFIIATGNVLAASKAGFPAAVEHPAEDGSGAAVLWNRLRVTRDWRWQQLQEGWIEVVTNLTRADERSQPPVGGLAPVFEGDRHDDYLRLTGWDVFQ